MMALLRNNDTPSKVYGMMSDDEFSLISGRQWATLTKSEFAQVIFHDVEEWYPTDGDVKCCYVLSELMATSPDDKVGLYRVGWSDPMEYVTFEKVADKATEDGSDELSVLFAVKSLPKDDGEFYQFCYLTAGNQVRGASTPFKFQRPREEDLVEIAEESDDDMMIVCSRTAVVEDKLRKANFEATNLTKEKYQLQKENEIMQTNVKTLSEELADCRIKNDELKLTLSEREQDITDMKAMHDEEGRNRVKYHEDEVRTLLEKLKNTADAMEHYTRAFNEVSSARDKLEKDLEVFHEQKERDIQKIRDEEAKKREVAESNLASFKEENSTAQAALTDMQDMVNASEKSKSMIMQEKQALMEFNEKLSCDVESMKTVCYAHNLELEDCKKNLHEAKLDLCSANESVLMLTKNVAELKKKISEKREENLNTKADLMEAEDELKSLRKTADEMRATQMTQTQEIKELREKISEGAVQYESKYLACMKLQKKVSKLISINSALEEKMQRLTSKASVCKSISSFAGAGSLTPGEQTLSAAMSMSSGQRRSLNSTNRSEDSFEELEGASAPPQQLISWSSSSSAASENAETSAMKCPMCSEKFPTKENGNALTEHLDRDHAIRMCPVCSLIFDDNHTQDMFISHVNHHFAHEDALYDN